MEFDRYPDKKAVFVDPVYVAGVEPGDEENEVWIRLYALGGSVRVYGTADSVATAIQEARGYTNAVTLAELSSRLVDETERRRQGDYAIRNIN